MKLCVTGSRDGRPDVEYWLDRWVRKFGLPSLLVLGDARGVDTQAYDWALARQRAGDRFDYVRELVKEGPRDTIAQRLRERDQRMADHLDRGDWCLGFPIASSKGTWLTLSMCRRRGASTFPCPRRAPDGSE